MTKAELFDRLMNGEKVEDIFRLSSGQDCEIYKADSFSASDEIIYIPDLSLNQVYRQVDTKQDAELVIDECYTGKDFVEICGGNEELAERIFWHCDWQHPESALEEGVGDDDEDNSGDDYEPQGGCMNPDEINNLLEAIDTVCMYCAEDTLEDNSCCETCPVRKTHDSLFEYKDV